ncbi:MAG TPA: hypothetical protein DEG71_11850 [Clostridiales bacterium]|nr:hypothetical protein [Clostridiales bacterium]
MRDYYYIFTAICLLLTLGTITAILLSLLLRPFKLALHRYRVNKINKEYPGDGPIFSSKYPTDYLELKIPIYKDFFCWLHNAKFTCHAIVVMIAVFATLSVYTYYWGSNTIGSVFSRNEYDTKYYVQLFPEGSESKNYLVPADLHVDQYGIAIDKVYWPNGGYTTFGNYDSNDTQEFYDNKRVTLKDDEDREWIIILTDKKVTKK